MSEDSSGQKADTGSQGDLNSGRQWKNLEESLKFRRPAPLFDQPMEITVQMLRGLRMVDETVVVHGDVRRSSKGEE